VTLVAGVHALDDGRRQRRLEVAQLGAREAAARVLAQEAWRAGDEEQPSECISNSVPSARRRSKQSSAVAASAAVAAVPARARAGRQARANAYDHRRKAGCREGRTYSGLSGSSIQPAAWRITPGAGTGALRIGVIHPALPHEAPSPQRPRSRIVTCAPRRRSDQAQHRPTTPPPTTATLIEPS
jgi:hypothetical protein